MVVNDYFYLHHPLGEWSKMLLTTIHYEGEILSLPSARILVAYGEAVIKRDKYLKQLIDKQNNGLIKVITGLRRVGKSYLLFNIYYDYLIANNVPED